MAEPTFEERNSNLESESAFWEGVVVAKVGVQKSEGEGEAADFQKFCFGFRFRTFQFLKGARSRWQFGVRSNLGEEGSDRPDFGCVSVEVAMGPDERKRKCC